LNNRLNVWPGASGPESHKPLFDVVVWLTVPRFVHLTFVPLVIVIVLGLNAKLTIFTRWTEVAAASALFDGTRTDATLGIAGEPTRAAAATIVIPNLIGAFPMPFLLHLTERRQLATTRTRIEPSALCRTEVLRSSPDAGWDRRRVVS
jgi:hypothetical protein